MTIHHEVNSTTPALPLQHFPSHRTCSARVHFTLFDTHNSLFLSFKTQLSPRLERNFLITQFLSITTNIYKIRFNSCSTLNTLTARNDAQNTVGKKVKLILSPFINPSTKRSILQLPHKFIFYYYYMSASPLAHHRVKTPPPPSSYCLLFQVVKPRSGVLLQHNKTHIHPLFIDYRS
jgi:hypothetical protein